MLVTQKCQYALKALLVLSAHTRNGVGVPIKIAQIAREQEIPFRFLEVILNQLKQGGFVDSRRGAAGGYYLAQPARKITVGDVVRFVDGQAFAESLAEPGDDRVARLGDVFGDLWRRANGLLFEFYDGHTLADMVEAETLRRSTSVPHFEI